MPTAKKILIMSANPKNLSRLRLDEEVREINEGLRRSKGRDQFTISHQWAVRLRDIRRAILDTEPNIIHFCGHGEENGILVEDDNGSATLVEPEALAGLLELFKDQVECVVLNACYSETQADAIRRHVSYVIGMSQAIQDRAAIEFSVGFYDAMGAGKSIKESFKFGCNAIQLYKIPQHLTPVLLQRNNEICKLDVDINDSFQSISVRTAKLVIEEHESTDLPASEQSGSFSHLISLIAQIAVEQADLDRFSVPTADKKQGGWSKSYGNRFLYRLFPEIVPSETATSDSLTVTYFTVRALQALKRLKLLMNLDFDEEKLDTILLEGKRYFYNHYSKGQAGLIQRNSQNESCIVFDIRHTASFGKGLMEFPGESEELIISAFKTVYKESSKANVRVPTQAEILSVLAILISYPKIRGFGVEEEQIQQAILFQEANLLSMIEKQGKVSFFRDPNASADSMPFYTWWVLDRYGEHMKNAVNPQLQDVYRKVIDGILSTESQLDTDKSGFPLLLSGMPEMGMTAIVSSTIARLEGNERSSLLTRCLHYLIDEFITYQSYENDFPFLYIYFFSLLEELIKLNILSF